MYGFTLSAQLRGLFMFLGLGFLLGIVYDVTRTIRLSISRGKTAFYVFDVLFAVLASAVTFCFALAVNYGEMHVYMLLGEIVGFFIYYCTFDAFVRRVAGYVVDGLKKIYSVLFRLFSLPVRLVCHLGAKIMKPAHKFFKKSEKNLKYLLQKGKRLVYNIFGISDDPNRKRKRATSDEEN